MEEYEDGGRRRSSSDPKSGLRRYRSQPVVRMHSDGGVAGSSHAPHRTPNSTTVRSGYGQSDHHHHHHHTPRHARRSDGDKRRARPSSASRHRARGMRMEDLAAVTPSSVVVTPVGLRDASPGSFLRTPHRSALPSKSRSSLGDVSLPKLQRSSPAPSAQTGTPRSHTSMEVFASPLTAERSRLRAAVGLTDTPETVNSPRSLHGHGSRRRPGSGRSRRGSGDAGAGGVVVVAPFGADRRRANSHFVPRDAHQQLVTTESPLRAMSHSHLPRGASRGVTPAGRRLSLEPIDRRLSLDSSLRALHQPPVMAFASPGHMSERLPAESLASDRRPHSHALRTLSIASPAGQESSRSVTFQDLRLDRPGRHGGSAPSSTGTNRAGETPTTESSPSLRPEVSSPARSKMTLASNGHSGGDLLKTASRGSSVLVEADTNSALAMGSVPVEPDGDAGFGVSPGDIPRVKSFRVASAHGSRLFHKVARTWLRAARASLAGDPAGAAELARGMIAGVIQPGEVRPQTADMVLQDLDFSWGDGDEFGNLMGAAPLSSIGTPGSDGQDALEVSELNLGESATKEPALPAEEQAEDMEDSMSVATGGYNVWIEQRDDEGQLEGFNYYDANGDVYWCAPTANQAPSDADAQGGNQGGYEATPTTWFFGVTVPNYPLAADNNDDDKNNDNDNNNTATPPGPEQGDASDQLDVSKSSIQTADTAPVEQTATADLNAAEQFASPPQVRSLQQQAAMQTPPSPPSASQPTGETLPPALPSEPRDRQSHRLTARALEKAIAQARQLEDMGLEAGGMEGGVEATATLTPPPVQRTPSVSGSPQVASEAKTASQPAGEGPGDGDAATLGEEPTDAAKGGGSMRLPADDGFGSCVEMPLIPSSFLRSLPDSPRDGAAAAVDQPGAEGSDSALPREQPPPLELVPADQTASARMRMGDAAPGQAPVRAASGASQPQPGVGVDDGAAAGPASARGRGVAAVPTLSLSQRSSKPATTDESTSPPSSPPGGGGGGDCSNKAPVVTHSPRAFGKGKGMGVPALPTIQVEPDYEDEDAMWDQKQYPISTPRKNMSTYNAVAVAGYEAQDKEELSFWMGDIVTVITEDPSGWWEGRVAQSLDMELVGKSGWFPYTYVNRIDLGTVSSNAAAASSSNQDTQTLQGTLTGTGTGTQQGSSCRVAAGGSSEQAVDPLAKLGLWKWNWQKDMWELCDFNGVPLSSEYAVASDPFSEECVGLCTCASFCFSS